MSDFHDEDADIDDKVPVAEQEIKSVDPELQALLDKVTKKYIDKDLDEVKPKGVTFQVNPIDIEQLSKMEKTVTDPDSLLGMLEGVKSQKEKRMLAREIKRKLDTKIIFRIPVDIKVDEDLIKHVGQIPRSKYESGEDRARFILECRKWERENLPQDEDQHYWTDKALEVLAGWIGVCEGDKTEMKQLANMCKIIFADRLIPSEAKLNITSGFYLANYLEHCYDLYLEILECPYTRLPDRAECCKFLYHSNEAKYRPAIEKHITEIIETDGDDDMRYETIACFVTDTGVATRYLGAPLEVEDVDQTLISKLFLKFIKTKPDIFYTIMASEFLLEQTILGMPIACDDCKESDMITFDQEGEQCECGNSTKYGYPCVKDDVCQNLLNVATDKDLDDRTRADAADVLINHSIEPYCKTARNVIFEIGEDGQAELEKNVFSNKENVHLLNDTFVKYIEKQHTNNVGSLSNINFICEEIESMADNEYDDEDIFKIRKSIDRIMLETTLHTERRISTSEIFRLIWAIIHDHAQKEQLLIRLMEELIDMSNTCSSGHAKRLVNVMVGFTDDLEGSIDIKDQLVANIKARLMATIKHLPEEQSSSLLEAMIGDADEKIPFINHIMAVLPDIKKELIEEFVDEGWVSQRKFDRIMEKTLEKLV